MVRGDGAHGTAGHGMVWVVEVGAVVDGWSVVCGLHDFW